MVEEEKLVAEEIFDDEEDVIERRFFSPEGELLFVVSSTKPFDTVNVKSAKCFDATQFLHVFELMREVKNVVAKRHQFCLYHPCWTINMKGEVEKTTFFGFANQLALIKAGNFFRTEEEAIKAYDNVMTDLKATYNRYVSGD